MSYEPPTPPADLPSSLAPQLEECNVAELRALARHAEALAEYQEREQRLAEADESESEGVDVDEPRPDGVPGKALLVTKTINDNQYYYWQWREGDKVKSKYHGPVESAE